MVKSYFDDADRTYLYRPMHSCIPHTDVHSSVSHSFYIRVGGHIIEYYYEFDIMTTGNKNAYATAKTDCHCYANSTRSVFIGLAIMAWLHPCRLPLPMGLGSALVLEGMSTPGAHLCILNT